MPAVDTGQVKVVGPGAELEDPGQVPRGGIYYYALQGQPVGPLGAYSLLEEARAGRIGARSYIWSPQLGSWQRVIDPVL